MMKISPWYDLFGFNEIFTLKHKLLMSDGVIVT